MSFDVGRFHVSDSRDPDGDLLHLRLRMGTVEQDVDPEAAEKLAFGILGLLGSPLRVHRLAPLAKRGDAEEFAVTVNGQDLVLSLSALAGGRLRALYSESERVLVPDQEAMALLRESQQQFGQLLKVLDRTSDLAFELTQLPR